MPYTNYLLIHFLHLVFGVLGATLPDDKIVSHAYSGVYSCLRPSCGCDDAAKWYRCDAGSILSHPNLWCITRPIVDYIIFDFARLKVNVIETMESNGNHTFPPSHIFGTNWSNWKLSRICGEGMRRVTESSYPVLSWLWKKDGKGALKPPELPAAAARKLNKPFVPFR